MRLLLLLVLLAGVAGVAQAQNGKVYQCVRPDGTVVCTTRDTSGDPSVTCNYECPDCNMVCAARLQLTNDDGALRPVTPPPVQDGKSPVRSPNGKETPEYCQQQYQKCLSGCTSNKLNKSRYDVESCQASCMSWYSGCGTNN